MADEYQTGICSGNWWNSGRNESSPCSTAITDARNFGWPNEMGEMKARYSDESVSGSSNSMITSFGLSTSTLDWNQSLLRNNGTSEHNLSSMLEEDLNSRSNFQQASGIEYVQVQKEWSPKNYSDVTEDSSVNAFTQINQALGLDQNGLNSSGTCFPVVSSTTLLPDLFESHPQTEQNPYETRQMNYSSPMNYQMNMNELSPWQKFPQFLKPTSPKQQPVNHLPFSNNTSFWNASASAMNDVGSSFSLSPQTQFLTSSFEEKAASSTNMASVKLNTEGARDTGLKRSSEPTFKRPRIETPSPLPTFKVRKEKLGDRITALQQLVSPFGKTDTASVLFEAIEYIKFLHDQVHVLSTPYMKNGAPMQYQQNSDKSKNIGGAKQDLRSRGLCLVPISSTFPVTTETTADFWTPTYGGTYR